MFCFQCQEACQNTGCTLAGMCGKKAETAHLMDEIIRQLKLIALSRKPDKKLGRFVIQSLFMTITNANFDIEETAGQRNHFDWRYRYRFPFRSYGLRK